MSDRDYPESIAFQRCSDVLKAVSYRLETIADRVFANELIHDDLHRKCLDKGKCLEDRTRLLLAAIQDRIRYKLQLHITHSKLHLVQLIKQLV